MKYKKIPLFLASLMAVVTIFSASATKAFAVDPVFQVGVVEGLIAKADNTPAAGASVDVLCNGVHMGTVADASGFYMVAYAPDVCGIGESVLTTASLGAETGSNTGTMTDGGSVGFLHLDVAIVHVPLVPEFGLLTGALTALTSGGLFLLKKRV